MAPASASFQTATKGLEGMNDGSWQNTAHGNVAGQRCAETRDFFQAVNQRSEEVLRLAERAGWSK